MSMQHRHGLLDSLFVPSRDCLGFLGQDKGNIVMMLQENLIVLASKHTSTKTFLN